MTDNFYTLANPETIPSPALLLYPQRVEANIERLLALAGNRERLRPHVKTHKLPQVVAMHQAHGIDKAKCATIAEAEMLGQCGVADILLAYQPVGPNQQRMLDLVLAYPNSRFGCLIDNAVTLAQLDQLFAAAGEKLAVWIDIDDGMGRSGIAADEVADQLVILLQNARALHFAGLHVYDGQFAALAIDERIIASDLAYAAVDAMVARLAAIGIAVPNIVAGGSPTFPVHARQRDVDVSPGTYVFWDAGYGSYCPELPFEPAALVLTRVISQLSATRLCVDLGSKSVSADNPLQNRVRFLNAPAAVFIRQSEEHLVIELPEGHGFVVGDLLYGVPWHICPTVALHMEANVIDADGQLIDRWPIVARDRRITI